MPCAPVLLAAIVLTLARPATPIDFNEAQSVQAHRRQLEWMHNFFCVMAVNRYLELKADLLKDKVSFEVDDRLSRKFMANVFKACIENLEGSTDLFFGLVRNPTEDHVSKVDFPFYKTFDAERLLRSVDLDLSANEQKYLHIYTESIEDIRQKFDQTFKAREVARLSGFDPIQVAMHTIGDMTIFVLLFVVVITLAAVAKCARKSKKKSK